MVTLQKAKEEKEKEKEKEKKKSCRRSRRRRRRGRGRHAHNSRHPEPCGFLNAADVLVLRFASGFHKIL